MVPINSPIYLANFAVDMRKSIDGLSMLVSGTMDHNPGSGALYIFLNRARNKIKILYFERNGFCLWYKRLERGRFQLPKQNGEIYQLERPQLEWLLSGLNFSELRGHPQLDYSVFC